jgi:LPS-assembly lipoprotein
MRILLSIVLYICLLCLTGCTSYRPLYGKGPNGEGVTTSLAAVAVPEQHTRSGLLVRNELLSSMGSAPVKFSLKMVLTEKTVDVSILSASNLHRRRFSLAVHYDLVSISSGVIVSSGDSFSNVSFDTVRQPVADLQAANTALERAAQEVGQDLRQRIAAYFADHPA